jgi:hypothetical protein
VIDDYGSSDVFDLPPKAEWGQVEANEALSPKFRHFFTANTGQALWITGRKFQSFIDLDGTEHTDLSGTDPNYFVDRFSRSYTGTAETPNRANNVTVTVKTSHYPEVRPHYSVQAALSGNGRDVQAEFSYDWTPSSSRQVPSELSVAGCLTYGPEDFSYQEVTLASLVVASMRLGLMAMEI